MNNSAASSIVLAKRKDSKTNKQKEKNTYNLAEGTLLFGVTSFHISVEYRKVPS